MIYSELKAQFTGILNRRDITPAQITTFMSMGLQYIQRKLRVPAMEKLMVITSDGTNTIAIPADYLEPIALYTSDAVNTNKLERRDLQTVLRTAINPGTPVFYCRVGTNFIVGPTPSAGSIINLNYYASIPMLSADTDHNWLTDSDPDVMIYAALMYSSDYFLDDRKPMFKATMDVAMQDVQDMADRNELVNASITPLYPDQTLDQY